jgi:hypothetical protein
MEVLVDKDPTVLGRLKVGESYNVTYFEAYVVSVEPTGKR